jgi:hypothetical protein
MKKVVPISSTLKDRIFTFIHERCTVTFAELRLIAGFSGDRLACVAPNVVVWADMSEEAITAINELIVEGHIVMQSYGSGWTGLMTYGFDRGILPFPLARRLQPYKRPRWLPVYIADAEWVQKMDERQRGGSARRGRPPKKRFLRMESAVRGS